MQQRDKELTNTEDKSLDANLELKIYNRYLSQMIKFTIFAWCYVCTFQLTYSNFISSEGVKGPQYRFSVSG